MGCAASPKGMRDQSLMVISSAFFPQKKTPRTAENYARESRIFKASQAGCTGHCQYVDGLHRSGCYSLTYWRMIA